MPKRSVGNNIRRCCGTVLDIGCADGWLKSYLDPAVMYVGLDYPATATVLYKTRPHVFGDASNLPFKDGSFDAVVCYEVLEHVRDPVQSVAEIARVLKFGGCVEFSMPFLYPIHDAPYDFQRWTHYGWERSLAAGGLAVESIEPTNPPLYAAAVLGCIALAEPLRHAKFISLCWRLPIAMISIFIINSAAWIVNAFWPESRAMATGYRVNAKKSGE